MNMTPGGPAAMSGQIAAQQEVQTPLCVSITITHPHFYLSHTHVRVIMISKKSDV
jgi:hypothetical protein